MRRSGEGETAMVRLNRADRDERIRPLRQRLGDKEFQLARLVAPAAWR
jgi:hypothetical protein